MCMFCGASFPYVLWSIGEHYVVIGEACKSLFSRYRTRVTYETSKSDDHLSDLPAYLNGNKRPFTENILVDFTLI